MVTLLTIWRNVVMTQAPAWMPHQSAPQMRAPGRFTSHLLSGSFWVDAIEVG